MKAAFLACTDYGIEVTQTNGAEQSAILHTQELEPACECFIDTAAPERAISVQESMEGRERFDVERIEAVVDGACLAADVVAGLK